VSLGVYSLPELERECSAAVRPFLIDGIIPECSLAILAGDSGLGKSAFAYQLGLCMACGLPFLGHRVKQGKVLYIDLENGKSGIVQVCRALGRSLQLERLPENISIGTERFDKAGIEKVLKDVQPALVIIDSLRAFSPEAESKNATAAAGLSELRTQALQYQVTFLVIHHIRKPSKEGACPLEDSRVTIWMNEASGARALINQTDVRIGFDVSRQDDSRLIVKGFTRIQGEFGPLYLRRVYDEEGEPIGYEHLRGIELISNPAQQEAFKNLPPEFRFKDAKRMYGREDQATSDFLRKCEGFGLLLRVEKGLYRKVAE